LQQSQPQQASTPQTRFDDPEWIYYNFRNFTSKFYLDFVIDKNNENVIKKLCEIAAGQTNKKGLIVHGPVGTGKTLLLLIFADFRKKVFPKTRKRGGRYLGEELRRDYYKFFTPNRMLSEFVKNGHDFLNEIHGDILMLDDMGEQATIQHFGNVVNVLAGLIMGRYDQIKLNNSLEFYGTTNLTSKQLSDIIGVRAFSRLIEMCDWNDGVLVGKDRRFTDKIVRNWPKFSYQFEFEDNY